MQNAAHLDPTTIRAAGRSVRYRDERYAFLADVAAELGVDCRALKARALELHRQGRLILARCDLVAAYPVDLVEASAVQFGVALFHRLDVGEMPLTPREHLDITREECWVGFAADLKALDELGRRIAEHEAA